MCQVCDFCIIMFSTKKNIHIYINACTGSLLLLGTTVVEAYSTITVDGCVTISGSLVISDELVQQFIDNSNNNNIAFIKSDCFSGNFTEIVYNSSKKSNCEN